MFVRRSKYDDLADRYGRTVEELDDTRDERDAFRESATTTARQFAEADAAVKRLTGRVQRLQSLLHRNDDQADAAYVAQLERRVQRLASGTARWMTALWAERAESLKLARQIDQARSALTLLRTELQEERDARRPIEGGTGRPAATPPAELLQARAHARALEERLAELTAANHAFTCGGGA
ncbi:hypothetical protein ACWD5Q_06700 [Streptomyces sp. NPDC002513]